MINYTWTDEDVKLVEKFIELKNKGYYADGAQLTQIYNRVLNKRVNPTNCGSCIRQRIMELESALNHFKEKMKNESDKNDNLITTPQENNNAADASTGKEKEDMKERMKKVRAARKKNK